MVDHLHICVAIHVCAHIASPGISSSPITWPGGPAFPGTAGLSLWLGWSTRIERTLSRGRARTMALVSSRMGSGENRSLRCRARRRHPAWPDRARRLSSRRKMLEPKPMARKRLSQSHGILAGITFAENFKYLYCVKIWIQFLNINCLIHVLHFPKVTSKL